MTNVIVSGDDEEWQQELEETYQDFDSLPDGLSDGSGGPVLTIWTADRDVQLARLGSMVQNVSEFEVPPGVSGDGWERDPITGGEDLSGIEVRGRVLDQDGYPMSGTATLVVGDPTTHEEIMVGGTTIQIGGVVASEESEGGFHLSGFLPGGIFLGKSERTELQSFEVLFQPATAGIPLREEFELPEGDIGTHQYGSFVGSIEEYDGTPMEAAPVVARGQGANTDENGEFEFLAPGGDEIEAAIVDSIQVSMGVAAGEVVSQSFTLPKLTIEVVDPEFNPIEGAPVRFGESVESTDEYGEASLSPAPMGDIPVSVMDYFESTITVSDLDTHYQYQVGPGVTLEEWAPDDGVPEMGGVEITCLDANSGRAIRGVSATLPEHGLAVDSSEKGVIRLVTTDLEDRENVVVQVGTEDQRYAPESIEIEEMPEGQMASVTVHLRRKEQTVNY